MRGSEKSEVLVADLSTPAHGRRMRAVVLAIVYFAIQGLIHADTLPPVESVLQRVLTNSAVEAKNDRAFRRQYRFVKTRSEVESNATGEVKKRSVVISTNEPRSVVGTGAKSDGSAASKTGAKRDRKRSRESSDKRSMEVDPELLSHFEFVLEKREVIRERPAFLIHFTPKAVTPAKKDLVDKFLQQIAGKVWVDEEDGVVVRLELRLLGPVDVVGGIAGSLKSLDFVSEREKTPQGHWFTRTSKGNVDSRQLFSRKVLEFSETIEHAQPVGPRAALPLPADGSESRN